ncbi:MAG: hypothetical protein VXW81_10545 [Pseudomonadota bacterium]|nr:hypothetical protein [Pseudomonadota bacterium]
MAGRPRRRGAGQARGFVLSDPALYPDPGARPTLDPPRFGAAETETAFLVDRFLAYLEGRGGAPWFAHMSFLRPHPPF